MKFYNVLVELAFYIPLLPAVLATIKWRSLDVHHRWFAILLWAIVAISFTSRIYTSSTEQSNNMPFFHVYILVEYLLLLQVFKLMFGHRIKIPVWHILMILFFVIWLLNVITGEGWWGFPDYIHALEAVIIVTLVIKWFLTMLKEKKVSNPEKTFGFWICFGLLIAFTGNFLMFLFPKFLINAGREVFAAIWKVNAVLIIIQYLSYTIALLWVKKTTKLS